MSARFRLDGGPANTDPRTADFISASRSIVRRWVCGVLVVGPLFASPAPAEVYCLTAANTHISFEIRRLGIRFIDADFHDVQGHFTADPGGRGSELDLLVQTGSVDAHAAGWTERLRSPQWLDTGRYPRMTYRSSRIEFEGRTRALVQGELSLHGVTRPLTFLMTEVECRGPAPPTPGFCRFLAHAQIRRSDFGLAHAIWQGGDIVDVILRGG
ncbi:MAG TPA: YceI family protein [Steroidobacteraceae bacterium]